MEEPLKSVTGIDIMGLLDQRLLFNIKRDFKLWPNGELPKHDFINIMLYHIDQSIDELELVGSLSELFDQIDVNHDEMLEWNEFSNHIIELGMLREERTFLDDIKNYELVQNWKDEGKHDDSIEHMFFLPSLKHLLVMERGVHSFKVYNMRTFRFWKKVEGHMGEVLSAAHAPEYQYVATSSTDLTIHLWDQNSYILRQRISCPAIPLILTWCPEHNILYSGGIDAVIQSWDLSDCMEKSSLKMRNPFAEDSDEDKEETGHISPIMALLPIKGNILASADIAGKIILWDVPQNTIRSRLGKDGPGVLALDWNEEFEYLFSAGLDREAYIWNPYVKTSIFKLSGHVHSLIGIKCVLPYQVVTADNSGMFKVWDIRTFKCVQTFNIVTNTLNCFAVTYPEKRILAGSKGLTMLKYDEPKDQHLADETHSICSLYNSLFHIFISVHAKCIKVWDAQNGMLKNVFRDLSLGDITCAQLDQRQRKLYLGDSLGKLFSINIKNGARIKKFKKHGDEVTGVVYWPERRFLISCSWDTKVHIHDDSKSDPVGIIRHDKIQHKESVSGLALQEDGDLLASCSDDGQILLNNLTTYRQEAMLQDGEFEVKFLLFLSRSHLLSSDLSGKICFWVIEGNRQQKDPVYRIHNANFIGEESHSSSVKAMAYDKSLQVLITGDDSGVIKIWDLSQFLNNFQESHYNSSSFYHMTQVTFQDDQRNDFQVPQVKAWLAHRDGITHIEYEKNLQMITSSSFDCNIHIWNLEGERIGSLILGYNPRWRVRPDIQSKMLRDRENAVKLLEEVKQISYEDLIRSKSGHPDHDSEEDEELDEIGYEIVLEKERKANHTMVHSRSELDMIIKADREALLERLQVRKSQAQFRRNSSLSNSSLISSHSSAHIKAAAKTGLQRAAVSMIFKK